MRSRIPPLSLRAQALIQPASSSLRLKLISTSTRLQSLPPISARSARLTRATGGLRSISSNTRREEDVSAAQVPAPTDLLELYRGLVATGRLKWDDEQVRCVMKLRQLLTTLEDYSPPIDLVARLTPSAPFIAQDVQRKSSWIKGKEKAGEYLGIEIDSGDEERKLVKVLSGEEELANLTTPKGILLTGPPVARNMILDYHVLYFDEFQLVDASSAALIRDVLSWYWRLGGVVVACSNRVPEDLYHHGVQRDRMIGFLDALKSRCELVQVDGGRDWRARADEEAEQKVARWYDQGDNLGPADYLTLASSYSTFFIDDVPILYLKHKNEARRLINLVDALYESRCQIHIRSPATARDLFFPDALALDESQVDDMTNDRIMAAESLSETVSAPYRPNTSLYNTTTAVKKEKERQEEKRSGSSFSVLGIWTGEDEKFAYKRAVSRLIEMTTSPTYIVEEWLPLDLESRTWEKSKNQTTARSTQRRLATGLASSVGLSDDLAVEAGYSRPDKLDPEAKARKAPVIKEQHMWGVVDEWGEKAGKWGKGAKAYGERDKSK
ncbi:uncharacterized protein L201_007757 [Kwoniella dendrophila CBS 6074]|uniref:AFG1-family ATPase n=1 Tax=Kwoniella dendrophila CBS 6074 TaxID=1295534 RepID=A0AAX4K6K3_9TREE